MTLLSILFLLSWNADDALGLDELYISKMIGAAQSGATVLIVTMNGMDMALHLYDFEAESLTEIDSNMVPAYFPRAIAEEDGFSILDMIGEPKLYRLDRKGNYLEKKLIKPCLSLAPGERLFSLSDGPLGLLGTIKNKRQEMVRLIAIDFEGCGHQELTRRRINPDYSYAWFQMENTLYLVTEETGEVTIVDPNKNFATADVIRPGIEPVLRPKDKAGRRKYLVTLSDVLVSGDEASFIYFSLRDEQWKPRKNWEISVIQFHKNQFQETGEYLLGRHKNKRLVYFPIDREIIAQ